MRSETFLQKSDHTRVTCQVLGSTNSMLLGHDSDRQPDQKLIETLARGYLWAGSLSDGTCTSIEQLAKSVRLHPNIIRQGLRAAFLAPDITEAILSGEQPGGLTSTRLLQIGELSWKKQREAFGAIRPD